MVDELVLIVEDNEKNLKLVRDVLQYNGYRTVDTATAEEAIEIAQTKRPNLILMDIQLPGMDGISAFKVLRANPQTAEIPVIAVTASAMNVDKAKILQAGFDGYQSKPLHVREFVEEVRRVLRPSSSSNSHR
jgi:two-component system cell cycle response regulator DivK